jgi:hypothetical protein
LTLESKLSNTCKNLIEWPLSIISYLLNTMVPSKAFLCCLMSNCVIDMMITLDGPLLSFIDAIRFLGNGHSNYKKRPYLKHNSHIVGLNFDLWRIWKHELHTLGSQPKHITFSLFPYNYKISFTIRWLNFAKFNHEGHN